MADEIRSDKMNDNKTKKLKAKKDKNVRSTGFNFIDVIIIACVLAVVVLLFFVYSPSKLFGGDTRDTSVIYTLRISGVPAEYAAAISVGDEVTDPDGYILGKVASDVEVEPHIIYEYRETIDGSGGIVSVEHPDLVDLIITVYAEADHTSDGYTVDGKRIAIEAEYYLVFPRFESKGTCISLSEEDASDAGA